jgi:predicted PP-loop superfamily ATPase
MSEVFNEQLKEALENAQKLRLAGEEELSKQMCMKFVKKVALHNGVDLIVLFYGEQAYSEIKGVTDALKFIFIAKCAMQVYDLIYSKNPASYSACQWAKRDKNNSDRQLQSFFEWLQRQNRQVEEKDCNQFKILLNAMANSDNVNFKMSDRVAQLSLVNIVSGLVSGSIIITSDGELR